MKQYEPVTARYSADAASRQQKREKKTFTVIVCILLAVLVISGTATALKITRDRKNALPVDVGTSRNQAETVSETVSQSTGDLTEAASDANTTSAVSTTEAVSVSVTDYSATMYANEELNVRSSPDASSNDNIIGKYNKDDEINVTGKCANGWLRVDFNGKAAYCSGNTKYMRSEKETTTASDTKDLSHKSPYLIKVNRTQNLVIIYGKDDSGEYTKPIKAMVCSVGLNGKTELGTFTIKAQDKKPEKSRWRQLTGGVYGQYITRFNGSILFHSVPYYSEKPDDLEYNEYNKLGQAASAGCVRLCVRDAKWIYDNCTGNDTTVIVYDSSAAEPLAKPTPIKIDVNDSRRGWDPTDPDPNNPWN